MGSLYKQIKQKAIPEDAEVIRRRKGRVAKWVDRKGRRREAPLSDDGNHIVIDTGPYWAKYRDADGITRRKSTGCRDKQAAQQILRDWLTEIEHIDAGIVTAEQADAKEHAKLPIRDHIAHYIEHLRHKTTRGRRTNSGHVANVKSKLECLARDCRFTSIGKINRAALERWMHQQEDEGVLTGRTINVYRSAAMAFCRWAVINGRLVSNPLEGLYTADETRKKRVRRALTEEEIGRLLEVARTRPLIEAQTIRSGPRKGQLKAKVRPDTRQKLIRLGHERVLMYKTMIYTGLRKGELASLPVSDLHLEAEPPYLAIAASNAKNAKADEIPLRIDFAADLKEWVSSKMPNAKVFTVPNALRKILYKDLAMAGIPRIDDQGRRIDVHALRHTCGTQLAKAGVTPQVASRIMRHSRIDLTMKHYTHLALSDTSKAIEMLPDFSKLTEAQAQKMTGTDSTPLDSGRTQTIDRYAPEYALQQACRDNSRHTDENLGKPLSQIPDSQAAASDMIGSTCQGMTDHQRLKSSQHVQKAACLNS